MTSATELLTLAQFSTTSHSGKKKFGQTSPLHTSNLLLAQSQQLSYDQLDKLNTIIQQFSPNQGWFCFQSHVDFFMPGDNIPDKGRILYGEICRSDDKSLHIRQAANGGWIVTEYQELPDDNPEYIVEQSRYLMQLKKADFDKLQKIDAETTSYYLGYNVYWKNDDSDACQGYLATHSRFTGFIKGDK